MAVPGILLEEARAAYAEPPRKYHTFDHALEVMRHVDTVEGDVGWSDGVTTPRLAALFHDAVYVVGEPDNEARSAQLAREAIARAAEKGVDVGDVNMDRVARLIELTAEHGKLTPDDVTGDEALFLDCDMAILGQDAAAFDAFDEGVQWEYTRVIPVEMYRAGRQQFLERLLACERIYLSDYFHERLDARARENIARRLSD